MPADGQEKGVSDMRLRAWASVLIGIGACVLLWGHWWLFGFAMFVTVGAFWSLGIISNYTLRAELYWREQLRRNMFAEGHSEADIAERLNNVPVSANPDHVPDWTINLNLILSVACLGFLIVGVVLYLKG